MIRLDIGGIPTSLGEIINFKYHLDLIKNRYDRINLSFHKQLWGAALQLDRPHEKLWDQYLQQIGQLFFSQAPYELQDSSTHFAGDLSGLLQTIRIAPQQADLRSLLCQGTPLDIGPYLVLTTKVRDLDQRTFFPLSIQLWKCLKQLSHKYTIVILGEREVEVRKEYRHQFNNRTIYGLYEQILTNLPGDNVLDLTVAALGNTVTDLTQIQQDCLIMNQAAATISIGIGGNTCMSVACATQALGFRADDNALADSIYSQINERVCITNNWQQFHNKLQNLL